MRKIKYEDKQKPQTQAKKVIHDDTQIYPLQCVTTLEQHAAIANAGRCKLWLRRQSIRHSDVPLDLTLTWVKKHVGSWASQGSGSFSYAF